MCYVPMERVAASTTMPKKRGAAVCEALDTSRKNVAAMISLLSYNIIIRGQNNTKISVIVMFMPFFNKM